MERKTFRYGDTVAVTIKDIVHLGNVMCGRDYDSDTHTMRSYVVRTSDLGDLTIPVEGITLVAAPIACTPTFSDTPESARDWLEDFSKQLAVSDKWGHEVGGTADPHYWGTIDVIDSVIVPGDQDFDDVSVLDIDGNLHDGAFESLECICASIAGADMSDEDAVHVIEDVLCKRDSSFQRFCRDDDDRLDLDRYLDREGNERTISREDAARWTACLYDAFQDDWNYGYEHDLVDVVYSCSIRGLIPNAMFLTFADAEAYCRDNAHNLGRDAHPYLMCDHRDKNFKRLSRILRQVDWAHSCLTMKQPIIKYPS